MLKLLTTRYENEREKQIARYKLKRLNVQPSRRVGCTKERIIEKEKGG